MTEWIISSSVLILIVIALRQILKGKISLRLQYALWLVVLVRLLVPFSIFDSSISVMNAAREVKQVQYVTDIGAYENVHKTPEGVVQGYHRTDILHDMPVIIEKDVTEEEFEQIETAISIGEIFKTVWIAGFAVTLVTFMVSNAHFAGKLRKSREALYIPESYLPVYISSKVETPCMYGLFSPKIYVTPEAASNEKTLRHVLEHENTHFRHGDHFWACLRVLAIALHWYNPLVWIGANLSIRDSEMSCDEATIKRIGETERSDYGRTLIGLTCSRGSAKALLSTATTMTGGKKSIKERVTLIAKKPKTAVATLLIVALLLSVAVGCTFTGAKAESLEEPAEDITEPVEETPTEEKEEPKNENIYSYGDLEICIPDEYAEDLIVHSGKETGSETTLISVYSKAVVEAFDKNGDGSDGMGWIFSIERYDQAAYEDYLKYDFSGRYVFAKDDEWYYCRCIPTDVRFYPTGNKEDEERWLELNEDLVPAVMDDFITRNSLEALPPNPGYMHIDTSNAVPLTSEDSHDFVKAELYFRDGIYRLINEKILDSLEKSFASMTELGFAPACPFSSTVYIERADGKVFELQHAEDSCNVIYTGGKYYDYAPDYDTADFFELFGILQYHEEDELDEQGRIIRRTAYYWDEPGDVWEWFYEGELLTKSTYTSGDKSVKYENFYEYNEKGAVRKEVCYYNGSTERSHEYDYLENGTLKEMRTYDENGELYIITSYTHYSDWRLKEMKLYYPKDDSGYIEKYTYEEGSDEPKVEIVGLDGNRNI